MELFINNFFQHRYNNIANNNLCINSVAGVEDCKKGNITDEELEKAKQTYITLIDEIYDSPEAIIESFIASDLLGIETLEERKEIIKTITKEEIINVSKKIHIDTIYLLEGVNEDGEN